MFHIKVVGFQQMHQRLFDLERMKKLSEVNFKIFNLYFVFNIFVADIEIFSKHYNETPFD